MAEVVAKASAAVAVDLAEVASEEEEASEAVEDKTTEHVKSHAVTNKKGTLMCSFFSCGGRMPLVPQITRFQPLFSLFFSSFLYSSRPDFVPLLGMGR